MKGLLEALQLQYAVILSGLHEENPLFYGFAPQGVSAPYMIVNLIAQEHSAAMGMDGGEYEDNYVQFTLVNAERAGIASLLTAYEALKATFDEAALEIDGATCVRMRRLNTIGPIPDPDAMDGGWMLTVDYLIETDTEII